jgi:antagonist of KipI
MMADRQTAGGYAKIATVVGADIPVLAQCLPGTSKIRFQAVSLTEAVELRRAIARRLALLAGPAAYSLAETAPANGELASDGELCD